MPRVSLFACASERFGCANILRVNPKELGRSGVKVFTDTGSPGPYVPRWRADIRGRNALDLASLVDPSYDTGPYAGIRPRGEGYGVRGSRHVVTVPRAPSEKLAVLYGLLCGDGSLTSYDAAARRGK